VAKRADAKVNPYEAAAMFALNLGRNAKQNDACDPAEKGMNAKPHPVRRVVLASCRMNAKCNREYPADENEKKANDGQKYQRQ
jgi:hypothetical protein